MEAVRVDVRAKHTGLQEAKNVFQILAGAEITAADRDAAGHGVDEGQFVLGRGQPDEHERAATLEGAEGLGDGFGRRREYDSGVDAAEFFLDRAAGVLEVEDAISSGLVRVVTFFGRRVDDCDMQILVPRDSECQVAEASETKQRHGLAALQAGFAQRTKRRPTGTAERGGESGR